MFFLTGLALLAGCYVEDASDNPQLPLPYLTVAELFDSTRSEVQSFELDPTIENSIVSSKGSRFEIPANAFFNDLGNPAPGPIQLEITEAYLAVDMLLCGLTSSSPSQLWESAGAFSVNAFKGGERLRLNEFIDAQLPTLSLVNKTDEYELAYGEDVSSAFRWAKATDSSAVSLIPNEGFAVQFANSGWINPYTTAFPSFSRTASLIAEPVEFGTILTDQAAYVIFKKNNCLAQLEFDGNFYNRESMPDGEEAFLIIIGMNRLQLYLGIKEIILNGETQVEVPLEQVTEEELITEIESIQ